MSTTKSDAILLIINTQVFDPVLDSFCSIGAGIFAERESFGRVVNQIQKERIDRLPIPKLLSQFHSKQVHIKAQMKQKSKQSIKCYVHNFIIIEYIGSIRICCAQ